MGWLESHWGEILEKARKHPQMHDCVDFDDDGNIITSGRPMIESMICAMRSTKIDHYLRLLGYNARPPRVINAGVQQRMPMMTGGKGKKGKNGRR